MTTATRSERPGPSDPSGPPGSPHTRPRIGHSSARRLYAVAALAIVLAFAGLVFSASVGETRLPPLTVLQTLVGLGDSGTELIVFELRLPRVVTGVLVGAALGLSGALLQSVARNPLASPDILGINAGASVAAVGVVVLAGSAGGVSGLAASVGLPTAALAGAVVSGLVLYALAFAGRRLDPMRMVLVGVGIAAAGGSVVSWLLTLGDVAQIGPAITWLAGSLHAATWARSIGALCALVLVVPPLVVLNRRLDVLALGDDLAAGLGVDVDRSRVVLLLLATVLAGAATSAAGAIAFVALGAPQLAQRTARLPHPPVFTSAAVGAAAVVWADVCARQGFSWLGLGATELPVGLLTAAIGAPYLLYVVARTRPVIRRAG
ncbi:iron ABC transporter permease [Actinopolymorpha sp. B9G3]|uniref:FecCD family ABC transporter permease n=1 Tax=Actinopolymorpha sp. B9G3 TaxID=3158970 RepID=UPI0032D997DB